MQHADMTAPTRLWNTNFTLWFIGNAQSSLGSALAGIALSFLVLKQTGSAGAMGLTLALGLLPNLLAPLAGTLVDRIPLRWPLIAGNVLRAAIQIGIGVAALSGHVNIHLLNALAFVGGLIGVIYAPAAMGVLPRLVPRDQITRASGLMASAGQGASLLGLVGGGVLVNTVGSAPSLILDGLSFAVMAALLPFVALPRAAASTSQNSFWADLLAGLRYVRSSPLLTLLPLLALFINASLAPMEMLLPGRMLALGAGAAGFGLFFALVTGGMAAASLTVALLGDRVRPGGLSVLGLAGIGVALLALATTRTAPQLWAVGLVFGAVVGLTNTGIGALFATVIAPEFRGRVASLLGMLGSAGQPVTLLALAPIADRVPLAGVFAVAGLVTLLAALAWAWAVRGHGRAPAAAA